ncbi:phosphoribosylglycinamide formyltransferase [Halalkalibacter urbisdiaboli]|uniref:phosphoribosylglycinamide formyltransferase n=1 Tax=Halalkalibacter urbisdiaboli TaxID=1960589 RepID=UPI000B446DBD|nr:phosphoribosylglycinamide formyltransferase [Halalkalibacter urbisdiaboli]
MKVAIFASGSGTNAQAILEAIEQGSLDMEVALIFSDKPNARVLERAAQFQIPTLMFEPKNFPSKVEFEQELVKKLEEAKVEFIVLAGYMRLIGKTLLEAYEGKMVNIHPSLLPAFPGLDAIGQAFNAKVKVTGVTIHYVDSGMDTGPIIAQEAVKVDEHDTIESLTSKIQAVEHRLYPETLQMINTERIR